MARRPLVVGNWKMNCTRATAQQLLADLLAGLPTDAKAQVGVCPAYVFIPELGAMLAGKTIALGAQNVADQDQGAFTGEISAPMLKEFGCAYAIVGHSERRLVYGETNALVAARYAKAIEHGITPIFCVGETLEEREQDKTFAVIDEQLQAVLDLCGVASLSQAVIAYEPVWAIGTGRTATTEQAQEVHAYIRAQIAKLDAEVAEGLQILYGGSVKADNAAALFGMPDVDGGLVGGASLDAKSFLAICLAA
ncbi:triosephosphate isomerase [Methylomagnum ishizawai]|uniref:Triosephosphate isomerase n=1 Tax=Methylomagnum ishizawai TaxID=1760988 RepID=A0A1Y6CZ22_9GAMM|nr:triose-phosphate isomerase [Methylomagnum ishizawai]SMF95929.1 triosephosphate isomerase [Methylomagnum ishizawai]